MSDTDPPVIACLEAYAKTTRFEGAAKNTDYETRKGSQFQKNWLQAYDAKIAKGWKGP
jgi:hypothetical protein